MSNNRVTQKCTWTIFRHVSVTASMVSLHGCCYLKSCHINRKLPKDVCLVKAEAISSNLNIHYPSKRFHYTHWERKSEQYSQQLQLPAMQVLPSSTARSEGMTVLHHIYRWGELMKQNCGISANHWWEKLKKSHLEAPKTVTHTFYIAKEEEK